MFANLMDSEEREKLMELIYKLARCDGEYAEEEQEIVENYRAELCIDRIPDTDSIKGLSEFFASKSETVRRIVLFEVWSMILSDKKVSGEEEKAFEQVKSGLNLDLSATDEIVAATNALKKAYESVYDAVFK